MEKIGKYKIIEVIGKGAMGIVYKAQDPDINRIVALKTIRFDTVVEDTDKGEMMKRFIREAQAVGKLEHSNIVTVYDVGREKNLTYIVMQFIEGESLQSVITSGKRYPPSEIVRLMSFLCNALDYAHQEGVVHRDMKPANILIDKKGNPYVVDFGVARMEMSTMTSTGAIIGTPSYMAPEQVMGKQVDSRADVFALGVIFFELLTGKRPFEGEHITTVAYKIIHEDPPTLKEINKDIPQEFEDIVRKAIAKNPDERFQSCREMADALLKQTQSYAETIPFDMTDTVFSGIRTEKKRKLKPLAVVIPVTGILVGAMGAYLFLPGVKQLFTTGGGIDNVTLPFAARQVILDTGEREVQEFGRPVQKWGAQRPRGQSQISQSYAAGISSYNQGDYRKSAQYMTEVLKLDNQHSEAKRYLNLANSAIVSIRNIRAIIERQRKAEEEKELPLLLNDLGSVDLYQQKSSEIRGFFNKYDEIKSIVDVGKIQINFDDMNNARVSFPKLVSAVDKETGGRDIVFEGQITWTMQKQAAGWKIIDLKSKSF